MKRVSMIAVALLGLAGCVFQNMDDGLKGLVGQDVHVAISALGYPVSQRPLLGDTIYVWSTSQTFTSMTPVTSTTTGYVGTTPVQATTTNYVPTTDTYACTIQMAVDSNNRIKSYQWQGNMGGCARYSNALKQFVQAAPKYVAAPSPTAAPSSELDRPVTCLDQTGTVIGTINARNCVTLGGTIR